MMKGSSLMRLAKRLCFIVLMSSLTFAQTSTSNDAASTSNVADQLKKLQDAMTEQQKQITQQQQQILKQQQEMEALRQQLGTKQDVSAKTGDVSARAIDASLHNTTAGNPTVQPESEAPAVVLCSDASITRAETSPVLADTSCLVPSCWRSASISCCCFRICCCCCVICFCCSVIASCSFFN